MPTGKTLGILGGGQLGRLIAEAARTLGYRTAALDSAADAPALQAVDAPVVGAVDDPASGRRLAEASDVVTLEWELIPAPVLDAVARLKPLYPAPPVLDVIRDRLTQRRFLAQHGFPQTEHGEAGSADDFSYYPVIVKRRTHGYDGKGQARLKSAAEAAAARELFAAPCVWEKIVPFRKEISVILARGRDGGVSVYPVAENLHRDGILHATRAPAQIPENVARRAEELARAIAEALGHVGVMAVEMFLLENGDLLVNEIAPRVHNSGHYTLGGCATSQFEQHVRAVCGLPFGATDLKGPAVMVNLLGDLWENGVPDWTVLDGVPGAELHLYGKSSARRGRKMGHYTVVGASAADEWRRADERLDALARRSRQS
ncbi:MAG: 5-(carboxyamino)imidazole ribonucleotide synthase [Elusimicrobia bacterium]|nr:5-(carboxyamino)imidazole ribonucleotide synthase [Elusimicrobiota bacterium]MDE2509969.1 5-(carboxyamino)imidazole ribonucleotide synthase [Elusimicrobiota bacterium]